MKIFITGSSGFIGFHLAKKLLDKGIKVQGLDSMNNYYDINLKKSRLKILNKYKNFSFIKESIQNDKKLRERDRLERMRIIQKMSANKDTGPKQNPQPIKEKLYHCDTKHDE